MINEQGLQHHHHEHSHCSVRCISWSAIIVGALIGFGLTFLLDIFSVAISLSVFSMSDTGVATFAIGGLIGVAIGVIVAGYVAGWVSGYLGRNTSPKRNLGILYGFVTWCVALVITVLLANKLVEHTVAYSNFITSPTSVVMSAPNNAQTTNPINKAKAVVRNVKANAQQQEVITGFSLGAFIVFALFYLGAFSCCVGGHYGMTYKGDEDY